MRLREEVQALLWRSDDKLNSDWFHKKFGYRWLHGLLCRSSDTLPRQMSHVEEDFFEVDC